MRLLRLLAVVGLALGASSGCSSGPAKPPKFIMVPETGDAQEQLAPGLSYHRADRAGTDEPLIWWLSLGVARTSAERELASSCARLLALEPRYERFIFPDRQSTEYGEVLAGQFGTRHQAQEHLDRHRVSAGCAPEIKASGLYPADRAAPMVVHVLTIDPARFSGGLISARANNKAAGRTKTSALLSGRGALAATNGGFFVMEDVDGVVGESTGISILNGQLQSEPTAGRPWVMISHDPELRVTIQAATADYALALQTQNGETIAIDGVNRLPGLLRNCGALYDPSLSTAVHDVTCRPASELIAITRDAGFTVPASDTMQAFRVTRDKKLQASDQSAPIDHNDVMLVATGSKRDTLIRLVASDQPVTLSLGALPDARKTFAVNGGPTLLKDGRAVAKVDGEGWPFAQSQLDQANAMHRFITLRAPRTAIGVTASGKILLVVVDGWRYRSDLGPAIPMNGGATIAELAQLMRKLGADDALNIDGGGSSVMALQKGVVSNPSDPDGERVVGDSLLVLPTR